MEEISDSLVCALPCLAPDPELEDPQPCAFVADMCGRAALPCQAWRLRVAAFVLGKRRARSEASDRRFRQRKLERLIRDLRWGL